MNYKRNPNYGEGIDARKHPDLYLLARGWDLNVSAIRSAIKRENDRPLLRGALIDGFTNHLDSYMKVFGDRISETIYKRDFEETRRVLNDLKAGRGTWYGGLEAKDQNYGGVEIPALPGKAQLHLIGHKAEETVTEEHANLGVVPLTA